MFGACFLKSQYKNAKHTRKTYKVNEMKKVKTILRNTYEQMHQLPRMKGMIVYYDVDPM